ncbi:MAG: transposase [Candidatus Humimicrobiaceae bacterium]
MKGTRYDAAFKKEAIAMVTELGLSVTAVSDQARRLDGYYPIC